MIKYKNVAPHTRVFMESTVCLLDDNVLCKEKKAIVEVLINHSHHNETYSCRQKSCVKQKHQLEPDNDNQLNLSNMWIHTQ